MYDSLTGIVTGIINGDSFEMKVTELNARDPDQYDDVESIHIDRLILTESGAPDSTALPPDEQVFVTRTPEDLEARLMDKTVRCMVKRRDDYGHLLSDVTIL
jgi:endonuclease YncB( thermonuclease family)